MRYASPGSWLPALLAAHSEPAPTHRPDPAPPRDRSAGRGFTPGVGALIKLLRRRGHEWLARLSPEKLAELAAAVKAKPTGLPPDLYLLPSSLRMVEALTPGQATLLRARMR